MANKASSSRKKKVVEPEIIEPEEIMVDEVDESYEPVRPVATRRHRIVTEYTEKKPLDEIDTLPDEDEETNNSPQTVSPPDPIEAFLDGMGGSTARWDMVVYRLPKYWQDARTDPASRVRCGRIDFTEEYENEVQRRWARPNLRNDFVIVVKKNGQYHKQLPTFSCEPALPEERINQPDASNPPPAPPQVNFFPVYEEQPQQNGAPPPPAAPDPMKQLKELLQMQKLMRDAIGPTEQPPPPPAAPLTDPDAILISSLAGNDKFMDRITGGLVGKILGKGAVSDEPWYAGPVKDAVKSGQAAHIVKTAIDSIFNGVRGLFPTWMNNNGTQTTPAAPAQMDNGQMRPSNEAGMVQGQGAETAHQEGASNVPSAEIRQVDVQAAPQQQQPMMPVDELVFGLIGAMERQAPVEEARTVIRIAIVRHPELGESVDEILNLTADDILGMLAAYYPQVSQMSHAREWIESLIASFPVGNQEGEE